jgi:hypothetical protein
MLLKMHTPTLNLCGAIFKNYKGSWKKMHKDLLIPCKRYDDAMYWLLLSIILKADRSAALKMSKQNLSERRKLLPSWQDAIKVSASERRWHFNIPPTGR